MPILPVINITDTNAETARSGPARRVIAGAGSKNHTAVRLRTSFASPSEYFRQFPKEPLLQTFDPRPFTLVIGEANFEEMVLEACKIQVGQAISFILDVAERGVKRFRRRGATP